MGRLIGLARDRAPSGAAGRLLWGAAVALGLPALSALAAAALVAVPWLGWLAALWLLKSSFAITLLGEAGLAVGAAVEAGDLARGRARLSWLCSRDASGLCGAALSGAAIESLAENSSDSAVAPLLWFVLAGVPGALAYRCVNTLDAMIGYRDRFFWLGKPAARLDDLLNLLPARLTAILIVLRGPRRWQGLAVLLRDRARTDSPNAGWPMAAMAGVLGVRLSKDGAYDLGAELRAPAGADVVVAWQVCRWVMGVWGGLCVAALLGIGLLR